MKISISRGVQEYLQENEKNTILVDGIWQGICNGKNNSSLQIEIGRDVQLLNKSYNEYTVDEITVLISKKINFGTRIEMFLNEKGYGNKIQIEGVSLQKNDVTSPK